MFVREEMKDERGYDFLSPKPVLHDRQHFEKQIIVKRDHTNCKAT